MKISASLASDKARIPNYVPMQQEIRIYNEPSLPDV